MKPGSILFLLAALIAPGVVASAGVPALLRDSTGPVVAHRTTGSLRQRVSEIVPGALIRPPMRRGERMEVHAQLLANLFPETFLPVILETVERDLVDSYTWTGRIEGDSASHVTISMKGSAKTAVLSTAERRFVIRSRTGMEHDVVEIDTAGFPEELEPLVPALTPSRAVRSIASTAVTMATHVDLLVAYTHKARGTDDPAAIESLISNAVAAANTAYANSKVTLRVRLVGTMEVTYDDTLVSAETTLGRLMLTNDGYMDEVHARRNALGADVVSLVALGPTPAVCGQAYVMTPALLNVFEQAAFSVVTKDCAAANFSLAHELGHTFGLQHDRGNSTSAASYPYAVGYQDPAQTFRSIMSYDCPQGCPRVPHFSNPDVLYGGRPTGVYHLASDGADGARALNDNAITIMNWRSSVPSSARFTDDPLVAQSTAIKLVHFTELRSAVDVLRSTAGLPVVSWGALSGGPVRASHVIELRDALAPATTALGRSVTRYTDASLAPERAIKAVHIEELRDQLR